MGTYRAMRPVRRAARGMLGAIFVASGARAVANPERLVPQAKLVTDRLPPVLEKDARTLVQLNGLVQLAGGLLLTASRAPRPAAAVLAASLVPTTVAAHPFWAHDDPVQRQAQQVHFLKNLGLLGGLLLAAADTEGRPGLRWRTKRMVRATRRTVKRRVT